MYLLGERSSPLHCGQNPGVADLRYESSLVGFLKPRPKLTFGYDAQLAFMP
ncbi:hypothetical protein C789_2668 [Microcystis aeruginosa FACHB-905 = DIANCHI905]|nr:hypothetical protein C789_2668 [Microcystis aeruginosa FACHB-905 = DIANCHI905]